MLNIPATPAPIANAVPEKIINAAQNGARGSISAGVGWLARRKEKNIKRGSS